MRNKWGMLIIVCLVGLSLAACSKCSKSEAPADGGDKAATEQPAAKAMDSDKAAKVAGSLAAVLCKRMVTCAPGAMTEEECVTETTKSLKMAMDIHPLNVDEDKLDTCLKSLETSSCEVVMGTTPPKGCEFLGVEN